MVQLEGIIASLIENSIVGGAFVYLLYYFTQVNNKAMEKISQSLERVGDTLLTLHSEIKDLNNRVINIEEEQRNEKNRPN